MNRCVICQCDFDGETKMCYECYLETEFEYDDEYDDNCYIDDEI